MTAIFPSLTEEHICNNKIIREFIRISMEFRLKYVNFLNIDFR